MDKMLKASLDWINRIANPHAGFIHPNDENKVKCASRALNEMGVLINVPDIISYCYQLGMPQKSIDKIVDWYSRPGSLKLKSGIVFESQNLKKIWLR
jgi:hypothetical protein